ncbi:conserved uncharacterized protein [Stigmatella aurantiaca DW4/3-1]|uniref:Conserved uncharacterized protein n=2 Tax=Stigmatella aurantiaca TaxID=41 RepID=E3FLE4_STIAD|nr:conserved uncharacterized protein [Stigmatella aurantiaca DW4/3-1]
MFIQYLDEGETFMKTLTGILVVMVAVVTACGSISDQAPGEEAMLPEQHLQTQESALVGDCTVSISCTGGSTVACSGSSGACSASAAGAGSVTCNGVSKACGLTLPTCTCAMDGCCNPRCLNDPDCR